MVERTEWKEVFAPCAEHPYVWPSMAFTYPEGGGYTYYVEATLDGETYWHADLVDAPATPDEAHVMLAALRTVAFGRLMQKVTYGAGT